MKITSIQIQNFKTFDKTGVRFSLNSLTSLIGENNVGKSNVLEALDLFFNFSKSKISIKSFHHNNYHENIEIEMKLINLSDFEKKIFKAHLDEKKDLTIRQIISAVSKEEGVELNDVTEDQIDFFESKHGTKIQPIFDYEWVTYIDDKLPTKANIKKWWKTELKIDEFDFKSYFTSSDEPSQDEYQKKLKQLWDEHEIPTESIVGDEKVLGWKSKLKANLPIYFYIPAIRSVSEDLKVTATSPLGEIIKWLSKTVSKEISDEFEKRSSDLIGEILKKIDTDAD